MRRSVMRWDSVPTPITAASSGTAPGRKVAVVAGATEDVVRALQGAGFEVRVVNIATSLAAGADQVRHFDTYNRTLASRHVAEIVAALKAEPTAVLIADGDGALPALLAAALVPVRRVIADVGRFDSVE